MRDDIIKYLCKEVERRCQMPSNHFDNVPSLLYLAYVNKKLGIEEGREFVRNKLKRSYEKLSDKSKMLYKAKYDQVMEVLN